MMRLIYKTNLQHLVSKIEKEFNTLVNDYNIVKKGKPLFEQLNVFKIESNFLGYIILPVDEDGEYIVTNIDNKKLDRFNFLDQFQIQSSIIPTYSVVEYIQREFQGRVYKARIISKQFAPNSKRIIPGMEEDNKFLYLVYFIN